MGCRTFDQIPAVPPKKSTPPDEAEIEISVKPVVGRGFVATVKGDRTKPRLEGQGTNWREATRNLVAKLEKVNAGK